uniref:Muscarinic toxin 2 n=1 Tax=Dendroaspis angusticeps TaxID=8618 RepID=3SUB_DENAN|nr:RecName: Full=Muscarinic toxin 2; Short=m2-toxin [Dendroaspis angusticeps]
RICHSQMSSQPPTTTFCRVNSCYRRTLRDPHDPRGTIIVRGCGCPRMKPGTKLECCTSDKCNV